MESEKIQEIIKGTSSVVLTLGENSGEQEILAREALRIAFQNKNILTYLFPETPENLKDKWSLILTDHKNPPLSTEISVRFPKNLFNIKEIVCEEDEEFLTLKILSKEAKIERGDIIFESRSTAVDALICLGSTDINFDYFRDKVTLPGGEKIIFVVPDDKTLSEKVFEIIRGTEAESIEKTSIPNLLLAALLLETNNFRKKVTEGSLNLAQHLLSLGADKKFVDEIIKKEISFSFAQILGRALARTRLNEPLQSNWTFISNQDFEKAGIKNADSSLVLRIVNKINEIIPSRPIFIALWEDKENNIWALSVPETEEGEKEIFEKLAGPYKNFSEAEIKIQQALKEVT